MFYAGGALVTIFAHCLAFRAGIAMRVNRRSDMSHNKSDVAFDGHKSAELVIYKRIMANGGVRPIRLLPLHILWMQSCN